jgi:hypothetical protein
MLTSTMPRRPRQRALFTASLALLALLSAVPALAQAPDYSGWQALLDHYLVRGGGKGLPAESRFDYEQLYVDEGIWSKKRSDRLEQVHAQLFAVTPSALDERTRLAWAINAYNFLVVERAALLLLVPRRQFQRYESVDQMSSPDGRFFDAIVAQVEGRSYSMTEFERRFVYGDTTPMIEPRRRAADPRLMFALCRGSVGGPPLAPRAFRPESLATQLDQATRTALAMPGMAGLDATGKVLLVSNYLGERRVDFDGGAAGILPFLEKHGPPALRSFLRRQKPTGVTRFTPVDPKLNQFPRPKPAPPVPASAPKS